MRLVTIAAAVVGFALVACADGELKTSEFGNLPGKAPTTKSEELPVQDTDKTEPADAGPADAGADAKEETPDWMQNCLPFIPCFPPEESKPADAKEEETQEEPDWTADCLPFIPCFPPEEEHVDNGPGAY